MVCDGFHDGRGYDRRKYTHRRLALEYLPSINGYFVQSLRHTQILILEIFQYIPVVKIIAFLDLEQNFSFLERR
jgi:hypothetical protein